jgi:Tol biopolymer transport system component
VIGDDPSLSPDGKMIAYTNAPERDGNYHIYVLRLDRVGTVKEVYSAAPSETPSSPAFSPDGKSIYFLNGEAPSIWVVSMDGRGAHQIADESIFENPTAWRPKPGG